MEGTMVSRGPNLRNLGPINQGFTRTGIKKSTEKFNKDSAEKINKNTLVN